LLQALHLLLPLLASSAGFALAEGHASSVSVGDGAFASNRLCLDVSCRCLKLAVATAAQVSPRHPPLPCLLSHPSRSVRPAEVPDERLDGRCRGPIFVICRRHLRWSAIAEPFSLQMFLQALVHGT